MPNDQQHKDQADTGASRIKVMLVDDQPFIAEALRRMLSDQPDVDYCFESDPHAAIATALAQRPTVILQDLVMPQVDGFALLQQFRTHPALRQVPVVVLSSREDPQLKAQGFALGANDYLVKWPDKIELLARVRYLSNAYLSLLQRDAAFSALAESQERLARANAELQKMAQLKDEFVATVSHELRTPLTSIQGSLSLLDGGAAGALPEAGKKLVSIASKSCDRLVRLISDLLDVERIESGNMEFDMRPHDLRSILEQAFDAMQGYASQYQVQMNLQPASAALPVLADRDRMIQVVVNLLSNAVKFSPPGGIVRLSGTTGPGRVRVSVMDEGEGVPEHFRDRVFQKFAQAESGNARRRGGTGLGLSICKRIVEEHGGTIGYDSTAGEGATFHVDLPLQGQ
ncbi:MAG TPA: hybrid sensor histidine kinase/response regulator [Noviherbaspirillum sp.]|jgi:signal transduction histidine kinase|uniref:sensor histidine kinase n=1 Tax=Noviherbaspirillum sp. TaxID=1926288 RepID=UPI002F94B907